MQSARARPVRDNPPPGSDSRQRLLQAAVEVFNRKGYAAATVREIVERAGLAKPALYYHFHSKEGLLIAVLQEALQQFDAAMQRSASHPGTTRERLVALGQELYELLQRHVPVVRVAHAIALGPEEAAPNVDFTAFDRSLLRALEGIVKDGIAAGDVVAAEPADVALALLGVIGVCASRPLQPGLGEIGSDGVRRILTLVFDGVLRGCPQLEERRS